MDYALDSRQVQDYRRDGYLFPLDVFDVDEVTAMRAALAVAREDAAAAGLEADLPALLRTNVHYLLPFVCDAARGAPMLDRVASILGPDLLLWSAEFFIKRARSDKIVSWHQDLTYWGLGETDEEMTAWLALSDVDVESGCMRFVPGSHRQAILPHRDTFADNNLLSRGQEVAVEVDEDDAVDVLLQPGQVSFHHGRIFHASGPNRSDHDRIGLVFRFVTPNVRQQVARRDYAMLLRGIDDGGNWIHVASPRGNFEAADLALRARVEREQMVALGEGAEQEIMRVF